MEQLCLQIIVYLLLAAYMYGLMYHGPFNPQPHMATLLTPALYIEAPHCLELSMFSSTRLQIYQTAIRGKSIQLLDSGRSLGFKGTLTPVLLNLREDLGTFNIELKWTNVVATNGGYIAVLKKISLKLGVCSTGNELQLI